MLRKKKIALALGLVWGSAPTLLLAQAASSTPVDATQLHEITVSATRSERRVDNVPATVTVKPASEIEQSGARDIKDVFRDELGVSVRAAPTQFTAAGASMGRGGNEGINIRGLEGNQVLMLIDGIRVPSTFSFGSLAAGRGDYLDVDGIKTVEVLRGPASTQYGSDGLAGAVSFRTQEPSDLLKPGQSVGGFARSSYATIDRSWSNTLGVAGANERWQGMLQGTYRQGHEVDNQGSNSVLNSNRTTPNPVDYNNRYLLGKAYLKIDATQQLGFTFETLKRTQDTEVYSARGVAPLTSTSVIDLKTHDNIERNRVSVEHRFNDLNSAAIQRAETRGYWQDAKVSQFGAEDRNTAADRTRYNTYNSKVVGFSSLPESNLTGLLNQRLTYGVDWSLTQVGSVRDGTVPPAGETFPSKPFPDTDFVLGGAFVQSEIQAGQFSIIPGLRFDHYKLSPNTSGYSGTAVSLSGQAVTPRLGAVWQLTPSFAPYAQWAKGFRAPTPDQVNNGFSNLAYGYTTAGNANLKAEHADSWELGFRGRLDRVRYSVGAFDNRYRDFISQQAVSGAGTPANPTVFQYINLANAHIHGLEARSQWDIDKAWTATAGFAYAKGDSETKGVKTHLDTVQPFKLVMGLRHEHGNWGVSANLVHSAGKSASDISTGSAQFAPPAYNVLDLGFRWKLHPQVTLTANLNNVFNAKYWRWSDVSGLASSSKVADAYTAPGRNAQVSVRYDF